MRNRGLGSWTARRARKTPGAVALIHEENQYTYAELHRRATRLARRLLQLGAGRGDRIGYLGPNHPAYLESLFAAGMIGAVFVPLNTRLAANELEHCVADSGACLLIHATDFEDAAAAVQHSYPELRRLLPVDGEYERVVSTGDVEPLDEEVGLDDICLIMYTSGTTGRAKGAVLTHGNITWNSLNVLVDTDLAHDEVTLVTAPLFHTAALNMTCLPTLLKGGTAVLEASFDPARTLRLIERHRVTVMFGVPAMYQAVAAQPGFAPADLSSVRSLLCGGAPVPEPLINTYLERGLCFIQGYGMTEASPGVLLLDADHALSKAGSAGVPHFFSDVRLDTTDDRPGEVLIEGPNVMSGYWNLPEATAAVLHDGWFSSGDVATADQDGYLRIVDRIKDVIISGGENIYPAEVEQALASHPTVADSAVIGVPDARWGEVGRAVVVLNPGHSAAPETAAALLGHLDGRLARYKIPKSVVFAESLPRNGAGKVIKAQVRRVHGDDSDSQGAERSQPTDSQ
jgi:fatty-acyl-CoA synthase